jgi:hypothetical protein
MPNTLFIWQINSLSLHTVIIQTKPIKHFVWSPTEHILLIATENSKLYSFTLTNIYVVELVTDHNMNININKINWNQNGKVFTVNDMKNLIIGQPELAEEKNDFCEDNLNNQNSKHEFNEMENEYMENEYSEEIERSFNDNN